MADESRASSTGRPHRSPANSANLRLPLSDKPSLTDFLSALRGTRLEVRSGATVISGRLLSVERKTRISGGTTLEVDYIALLADNGETKPPN